jgi:hypothetical protein
VEEFGFRGNFTAIRESRLMPLVNFGVSRDRVGSTTGTYGYFVTAGKTIPRIPVSPYVSLKYSEFDEEFVIPYGATFRPIREVSLMYMNDGVEPHLLLNLMQNHWRVSLMWIMLERAGISVAFGF